MLLDHEEPPARVLAAAEWLGRPLRIALLPVGLELRCTLLDHKPSPLSAPNTTIRARRRRECWSITGPVLPYQALGILTSQEGANHASACTRIGYDLLRSRVHSGQALHGRLGGRGQLQPASRQVWQPPPPADVLPRGQRGGGPEPDREGVRISEGPVRPLQGRGDQVPRG